MSIAAAIPVPDEDRETERQASLGRDAGYELLQGYLTGWRFARTPKAGQGIPVRTQQYGVRHRRAWLFFGRLPTLRAKETTKLAKRKQVALKYRIR
ncbi:hypothetical protein FS782_21610 [Agrobacterium vitis]|nr:hypothetical protein [Agrobacterium vitis]